VFAFRLQARASLELSISHGIVERHRGWIEAESEVGWGSTFTVMLLVVEGQ
jgi:signal transduction histidine kinase